MMFLKKMLPRIMLISIVIVIVYLVTVNSKKKVKRPTKFGPTGMSLKNRVNCTEFSKFARFNPYSVLNEKWFVFYYWAPIRQTTVVAFTYVSANLTKQLKRLMEGKYILPVIWSSRLLLMEETNQPLNLLVERGDRGEFWLYPIFKGPVTGEKLKPRDVRMKQTGDNRIIGLMDCFLDTVIVMARINDVPPRRQLHEVASRLGYRGRKGKSYLYQGHEWGPIPEADEKLIWDYRTKKKSSTELSKESAEGSIEEVEEQQINKPKDSQEEKIEAKENKAVLQTLNEDEVEPSCIRIDPELWNDPKPEPSIDPDHITKEELNNLIDTDTTDILTIDAPDTLQNNKQESDLEKQTEKTQEKNKPDSYQDTEPRMPLHEPMNPDSHTENPEKTNTQVEDENCEVCFKSTVSTIISTNDAYRPENSRTIANYDANEPARPEVPRPEGPRPEVQKPEKSRAKVSAGPLVLPEDLINSSRVIIMSPQTIDDLRS